MQSVHNDLEGGPRVAAPVNGVYAVNAVQGLRESVVRPGVGHEDYVVGQVEEVALGHAFDSRLHDGDGRRVETALLEEGGLVTPVLLADAAIEYDVADVGLVEQSGEVVEGVVEGTEHQGLLAAFEDFGD